MAHVTLHFSFGIAGVTVLMMRGIVRRWMNREPIAGVLGHWILWSYAAGFFAAIPSLLRQAGIPDSICDGWWMNVFLLYPFIKRLFTFGGMPLGGLSLALCFAIQYSVLLAAIVRSRRPRQH